MKPVNINSLIISVVHLKKNCKKWFKYANIFLFPYKIHNFSNDDALQEGHGKVSFSLSEDNPACTHLKISTVAYRI